ncbi:MAG: restriction endonuclease [Tepidisphaeraceae bacterium]
MLFGYVAEYKLRELWFSGRQGISNMMKHDDHNRKKKGDLVVKYRGHEFSIECKSLQTNSIRETAGGRFVGKVQCDASDRRAVKFRDGSTLETTCRLRGEFDILAVNLFGFQNKWNFIFAKNQDLPKNVFKKYTPAQQAMLLPSLMAISWPNEMPFRTEPFSLMDELIRERKL